MSEKFSPSQEQADPANEAARNEAWGLDVDSHTFSTPQEFVGADTSSITANTHGDSFAKKSSDIFGELDRTISSGNNLSYEETKSLLDDKGVDADSNIHTVESSPNRLYGDRNLLELAQIAREANENGDKSTSLEAQTAIQDKLSKLVESGEITDEGAMNRIEQLDKIISSGLPERSTPEDPAPVDTHEREHSEAIEENERRNVEAERQQRAVDEAEARRLRAGAEREQAHAEALEEDRRHRNLDIIARQQAQAEKEANDRQILADYDEAMRVQLEKAHTEALEENKERDDSEAISKLLAESKERDRKTTSSLSTALKGLTGHVKNIARARREAAIQSKTESVTTPSSGDEPAVSGKKKSLIDKLLGGLKASPKETDEKTSGVEDTTPIAASRPIGSVEPQWNGPRQQSSRERQAAPFSSFNGSEAGSPADNNSTDDFSRMPIGHPGPQGTGFGGSEPTAPITRIPRSQ